VVEVEDRFEFCAGFEAEAGTEIDPFSPDDFIVDSNGFAMIEKLSVRRKGEVVWAFSGFSFGDYQAACGSARGVESGLHDIGSIELGDPKGEAVDWAVRY
jgi:hypothetical protein